MLKGFEEGDACPNIELEQSIQQRLDEAFGLTLCARFNSLDQTIEVSSPSINSLLKRAADTDFFFIQDALPERFKKD